VRRAVLRRQRNRMAATALAAVVAVGGALGVYLTIGPRPGIAPGGPASSSPAPSSQPGASSSNPASTPPSSPPPRPTLGPMPAHPPLSAPTELTLPPTGGKYPGTLTTTVRNTGPPPYGRTLIFMSYPDGVTYDFPNQPLLGPCLLIQGNE